MWSGSSIGRLLQQCDSHVESLDLIANVEFSLLWAQLCILAASKAAAAGTIHEPLTSIWTCTASSADFKNEQVIRVVNLMLIHNELVLYPSVRFGSTLVAFSNLTV